MIFYKKNTKEFMKLKMDDIYVIWDQIVGKVLKYTDDLASSQYCEISKKNHLDLIYTITVQLQDPVDFKIKNNIKYNNLHESILMSK